MTPQPLNQVSAFLFGTSAKMAKKRKGRETVRRTGWPAASSAASSKAQDAALLSVERKRLDHSVRDRSHPP
jgi:hypothetical protein